MTYRYVDIECYQNYFLLLTLEPDTGLIKRWERFDDVETGAKKHELDGELKEHISITFNGLEYDWWMLSAYLEGYKNKQLFELSKYLITEKFGSWSVAQQYDLTAHVGRHIDIMPILPLIASLKVYGGRVHAPRIQDLPVPWDSIITRDLRDKLIPYCVNDVQTTHLLHEQIKPQILLRHRMSKQYGLQLHSKSDPQIAEAVIKKMLLRRGVRAGKPYRSNQPLKYDSPACVRFESGVLKQVHQTVGSVEFDIGKSGSLLVPSELRSPIEFGNRKYKMGVGGLHSVDKAQHYVPERGERLVDLDVTSYYPSIILANKLFPSHLGEEFLQVYKTIVENRVSAKASGDKTTADALKIVINSSFGKFGNKYSILHSPKLLLQTTITGQLYLLMLIESIEHHTSCEVVSANTDGVTVWIPSADSIIPLMEASKGWEKATGMGLETVEYTHLHAQDVNNYFAVKKDGGVKGKGIFAEQSLSKNPTYPIIAQSIINHYVRDLTPEATIYSCSDIRQFVAIRKVTGGAVYRDDVVGATVRWYLSDNGSPILYAKNANRVPDADCVTLSNELPEAMPLDLDRNAYVDKAYKHIESMGKCWNVTYKE